MSSRRSCCTAEHFSDSFLHSLVLLLLLTFNRTAMSFNGPIKIQIRENVKIGTKVTSLFDHIIPRPLHNTKLSLFKNPYFAIESPDQLTVIGIIDRDNNPKLCNFRSSNNDDDKGTLCVWKSILVYSSSIISFIEITILDLNDNAPRWAQNFFSVSIVENSPPSKISIEFPKAIDLDEFPNTIRSYTVDPPSRYVYISVRNESNRVTPFLRLSQLMDRELLSWHNVTILAVDGGQPQLTGSLHVSLRIEDRNDNTPTFSSSLYSQIIDRALTTNDLIDLGIQASDLDEGLNSVISYEFPVDVPHFVSVCLKVNHTTGVFTVLRPLNGLCFRPSYQFSLVARDQGSPALFSKTTVLLKFQNFYAPEIVLFRFEEPVIVAENSSLLQELVTGFVKDKDQDVNGEFQCILQPSNFSNKFTMTVNQTKSKYISVFKISTHHNFDRETSNFFSIVIFCWDFGEPALTTQKSISIEVSDVNDNAPIFTQAVYSFEVYEQNGRGDTVAEVRATDEDAGLNGLLSYSIVWPHPTPGNLTTSSPRQTPIQVTDMGYLVTSHSLDRETHTHGLRFKVIASDHGKPSLSSSCDVIMTLLDINDNSPQFEKAMYNLTLAEDSGTEYQARVVGHLKAADADLGENALLHYAIFHPTPVPFKLDSSTGTITSQSLLDCETVPRGYRFAVIATDSPANMLFRKTATAIVQIHISDVNDNAPHFTFPNRESHRVRGKNVSEKTGCYGNYYGNQIMMTFCLGFTMEVFLSYLSPIGSLVTRVKATDLDLGNNARIRFSLVDPERNILFSIHESSGELVTSTVINAMHEGVEHIYIRASDCGSPVQNTIQKLSIVIGDFRTTSSEFGGPSEVGISQSGSSGFLSDRATFVIVGIVLGTFCLCCALITGVCVMVYRRWQRSRDRVGSNVPTTSGLGSSHGNAFGGGGGMTGGHHQHLSFLDCAASLPPELGINSLPHPTTAFYHRQNSASPDSTMANLIMHQTSLQDDPFTLPLSDNFYVLKEFIS